MVKKEPEDPRSTYRKRARKILIEQGRPYFCGSNMDGSVREHGCGRSPLLVEAPGGFYPGMGVLQANHINKILRDCDPANLEWLCASCHKMRDQQTDIGVSVLEDEQGYGPKLW